MRLLAAIFLVLPTTVAAQKLDVPAIKTACIARTFLSMQSNLADATTPDARVAAMIEIAATATNCRPETWYPACYEDNNAAQVTACHLAQQAGVVDALNVTAQYPLPDGFLEIRQGIIGAIPESCAQLDGVTDGQFTAEQEAVICSITNRLYVRSFLAALNQVVEMDASF